MKTSQKHTHPHTSNQQENNRTWSSLLSLSLSLLLIILFIRFSTFSYTLLYLIMPIYTLSLINKQLIMSRHLNEHQNWNQLNSTNIDYFVSDWFLFYLWCNFCCRLINKKKKMLWLLCDWDSCLFPTSTWGLFWSQVKTNIFFFNLIFIRHTHLTWKIRATYFFLSLSLLLVLVPN